MKKGLMFTRGSRQTDLTMPPQPQIRPMDLATDLEAVAQLIYDTDEYLFPFLFGTRAHALPVLAKLVTLNANSFSHRHILCATEGNEVVGMLIGYDHRTIDKAAEQADFQMALPLLDQLLMLPKYWILRPFLDKTEITGYYIQNVCVAANHRGKGIGSDLIRHFCSLHTGDAWLDVELGNKAALALYERLGFVIHSKKSVFLPGLGSYRMVKWHNNDE